MSEKKNNSLLSFVKRNLYYLVIGASLIIIATVIAIVLITNKPSDQARNSVNPNPATESTLPSESEKEPDSEQPKPSDSEKEPESEKPTDTKIVFSLPVTNSTVSKNYTSSTVVFNKTLGVYTGHMGIDFSAEAGTEVLAAYDGVIESITTSYLQGTTVTIDHGNGLKSIYNSIDAAENLAEGQKVEKGDVIGAVSDNNRQEYKDGAHLHFEVVENGKRIDPETYLLLAEK